MGIFWDLLMGNPVSDKYAPFASYDWCRFRKCTYGGVARCYFTNVVDEVATKTAGHLVYVPLDRGQCAKRSWDAQRACHSSAPGPKTPDGFTDATIPWSAGGQTGDDSLQVKSYIPPPLLETLKEEYLTQLPLDFEWEGARNKSGPKPLEEMPMRHSPNQRWRLMATDDEIGAEQSLTDLMALFEAQLVDQELFDTARTRISPLVDDAVPPLTWLGRSFSERIAALGERGVLTGEEAQLVTESLRQANLSRVIWQRKRDLLRHADRSPAVATPTPSPLPVSLEAQSPVDLIAQLAELHAAGALTDAEFASKKSEILDRL